MFENMVLREIFGSNREEITGEWMSFYNEEPYDAYFSLNINRTRKSSRIRWTRNVACMSRREMHAAVLWEVLK
jgi:hypothetical protein